MGELKINMDKKLDQNIAKLKKGLNINMDQNLEKLRKNMENLERQMDLIEMKLTMKMDDKIEQSEIILKREYNKESTIKLNKME